MKSNEAIRLNVTIHPDKDPALFKIFEAMSKDSRPRRLIGLGTLGLFVEQHGMTQSALEVPAVAQQTYSPQQEKEPSKDTPSNVSSTKEILHEDGELEAIGDIFNNGS